MAKKKFKEKLTIDVAETAGLALLCMVQATSPVNRDVAATTVEARGAFHRTAGADGTILKQAIEDRTISADVVLQGLLLAGSYRVRGDALEKFNVLVGMELGHLQGTGRLRTLHDKGISSV